MKRKNAAEEMFNDIMDTLKVKQKDLERTVNEYSSNMSKKPSIDMLDDDEDITLITELPGVKKEDIKIDITDDTVELTAQFPDETLYESKVFLRKERTYGEVKRTIELPELININESTAKFENGVLTLVLPKIEKKKSFEVKVD